MIFRELRPDECDLLKTFLYEAIFIPEGETQPDRSIIKLPELALYYEDFGKGTADYCLVADDDGLVTGAAWTRIMDDYGHINDETPSLAMSVLKDHRGQGIGTHLLQELISLLREKGYKRISLSVQKANYAVHMYDRAGFRTILENADEYIMVCDLLDESGLYKDLGALTKDRSKWKKHIPYVSSLLDHESLKIKAKALWLLGEMGLAYPEAVREVVPVIASFLDSPVPLLRERAINALGRIGKRRPEYVIPYLTQLQQIAQTDDNAVVRIHCLGAVKAAEAEIFAEIFNVDEDIHDPCLRFQR